MESQGSKGALVTRMQVVKERFEDAGEQDEQGLFDYYYAGSVYQFVFPKDVLVARRYEDTPDTASFMHRKVKGKRKWRTHRFEEVPYESAEFQQAVQYLLEQEGVSQVNVWLNEYVPVDVSRIS